MKKFKRHRDYGFFDQDIRLTKLSRLGNPLTEEQKLNNREKSRTRARVEHPYAFMEMSMNGIYLYAIGKKRIAALVGLINLTYNLFRKVQLLPC